MVWSKQFRVGVVWGWQGDIEVAEVNYITEPFKGVCYASFSDCFGAIFQISPFRACVVGDSEDADFLEGELHDLSLVRLGCSVMVLNFAWNI